MKQWDKCLCYRVLKILVVLVLLSAGHCLCSVFVCAVGFVSSVKYCVMFVTHTHTVFRNWCFFSGPCSSLTYWKRKYPSIYCDWWITFAENEAKTDGDMTAWDGYSCLQTPLSSVLMNIEMNMSGNKILTNM